MKKYGGLLLAIAVVLCQMLALIAFVKPASAAGCANMSSFGAISMSVPSLPKKGDYAIWIRLQGIETSSTMPIEINGANCIEVDAEGLSSSQWTWHVYKKEGKLAPLRFPSLTGNSIKAIGTDAGVRLDRVLLTEVDCQPVDFGDNCQSAIEPINTTTDNTQRAILPPPSDDPVSGKILLTSTPQIYNIQLEELRYIVEGKTIQTSTKPEPFDTTLLANGKYIINIDTKLDNGSVFHESTTLEIDNPENAFSPFIRWLKIHFRPFKIIGLAIVAFIVSVVLINMMKSALKNSRERRLRGL